MIGFPDTAANPTSGLSYSTLHMISSVICWVFVLIPFVFLIKWIVARIQLGKKYGKDEGLEEKKAMNKKIEGAIASFIIFIFLCCFSLVKIF